MGLGLTVTGCWLSLAIMITKMRRKKKNRAVEVKVNAKNLCVLMRYAISLLLMPIVIRIIRYTNTLLKVLSRNLY